MSQVLFRPAAYLIIDAMARCDGRSESVINHIMQLLRTVFNLSSWNAAGTKYQPLLRFPRFRGGVTSLFRSTC